jgi:DNA replicative helicase MCM subunit Mcm2 (Cdc46/Mcm family)
MNISLSLRNLNSEIESRNLIIESICPDIYEKYDIKLAILLCLIGGVTRIEEHTRIRG